MAVNPIIEYVRRDFISECCQSIETSAVNTAPPIIVECVLGSLNWSLPCQPLHMYAEDIIPTF